MLAPASAQAGTASLSGFGDINYTAPGETNNVTVTHPVASGNYRWTDAASTTVTADPPCSADNTIKAAECANDDAQLMAIALGSGNDMVNASAVRIDILAFGGDGEDNFTLGGGDDIFIGTDGNDISHGGEGNDKIGDGFFAFFPFGGTLVGSGNDQMFGDGGNDVFEAGPRTHDGAGADIMNGGTGVDSLTYLQRPGDLSVTIDNPLLGDGEPGEGDSVQQMEIVRTLGGNDFISDNSAAGYANTFYGMQGNDTLRGGNGNDKLYGGDDQGLEGSGDDTMNGGAGADLFAGGDGTDTVDYGDRGDAVVVTVDSLANDGASGEKDNVGEDVEVVRGGNGRDSLNGSDGRDTLRGGPEGDAIDGGDAADVLQGEDGDDVIAARDGAPDTVNCGAGSDMVNADTADVVAADCELVDRVAVVAGGGDGGAGGGDAGSGGGGTGGGGTGGGAGGVDVAPVLFIVPEGKATRRKGVRVHAACSEDCSLKLDIQVPARTARKYKIGRSLVARTRSLKMAQQITLRMKPGSRVRSRLRRLRRVKATLIATGTDGAGNTRTVSKRVTLGR